MKKVDTKMDDELRSEYDLRSLRVRKVGPERKSFGRATVQLEPDVAEVFPNSINVSCVKSVINPLLYTILVVIII